MGYGRNDNNAMPITDSVDDAIVAHTYAVKIILAGKFNNAMRARIAGERKYGLVDAYLNLAGQASNVISDTRRILNAVVIQGRDPCEVGSRA